jgi:hypothetical protein
MSKNAPIVVFFVEKISGIILSILGLILIYYTYDNLSLVGSIKIFSFVSGVVLLILGLILLIVRSK